MNIWWLNSEINIWQCHDWHKFQQRCNFSYRNERNGLDVMTSTIVMQVKNIVLKIEYTANKSTDPFPTSIANVNIIQTLTSKRNEQNCPKNVIALFLFLFLITWGSSRARSLSVLSWRYIKRKMMMYMTISDIVINNMIPPIAMRGYI